MGNFVSGCSWVFCIIPQYTGVGSFQFWFLLQGKDNLAVHLRSYSFWPLVRCSVNARTKESTFLEKETERGL